MTEECFQKNTIDRTLLPGKQDSAFFVEKGFFKMLKQDYPMWM